MFLKKIAKKYDKILYCSSLIALLLMKNSLIAQYLGDEAIFLETGKPLLTHYTSVEYQAGISNWSVVQDIRGIIYFGNQSGILEYDGASWRLLKVSNFSTVHSLAVNAQNQIFVGAVGELGYLAPDSIGTLQYHSLLNEIPIKYQNFEEVTNVVTKGDDAYFQTAKNIFRWKEGKITVLPFSDAQIHKIKGSIFISFVAKKTQKLNYGKIKNDSFVNLGDKELFGISGVLAVFPFEKNKLLIVSRSGGLFLGTIKDGRIKTASIQNFPHQAADFLKKHHITAAAASSLGEYAFSTGNRDIITINTQGEITSIINTKNGLPNTDIRTLFFDKENNLWLGLGHGIAKISLNPSVSYWDETTGFFGEINAIKRYKNTLFIATNLGLYYLENTKVAMGIPVKIKAVKGKISTLLVFENETKNVLLVGTQNGVFELSLSGNNKFSVQQISKLSRVKQLLPTVSDKAFFILKGESIYVKKLENNYWKRGFEIKKFRESISQAEVTLLGDLWTLTKSGDLMRVKLTEDFSENVISYEYDFLKGAVGHQPIRILTTNQQLFVRTQKELFLYNEAKDIFIKNPLGDDMFRTSVNEIVTFSQTENNSYWFLKKTAIGLLPVFKEEHTHQFKNINLKSAVLLNQNIKDENAVIFTENNTTCWIGGKHKLYKISVNSKLLSDKKSKTLIRKINTVKGAVIFDGYDNNIAETLSIPELSNIQNNLTFHFSLPVYYGKHSPEFKVFLEGHNEDWSDWGSENKVTYFNLPSGEYTFFVKGKSVNGEEGAITSYPFVIIATWYKSQTAYLLYVLIAVLIVILIVKFNTYRLNNEKKSLEKIVAIRTYEVVQQKEEIETQRNMLSEKNEEIQNQNEYLVEAQQKIEITNIKLISNNLDLEQEVAKRTLRFLENTKEMEGLHKELDTFIYRASHDLKGPVSTMQGLAKLMQLLAQDTEISNYLEKFNHSLSNMNDTISKLVTISAITQFDLHITKVDFQKLISEVETPLYSKIEENNIVYKREIAPNIDFYTDENFLKIILENILENAIAYYQSSERIQSFVKLKVSQKRKKITITIEDNGIGIAKAQQGKIFEMFYKGTELSKGNGLGLYTARKALAKLDSTISLKSKEGKGSVFTITLSNETA